MFGSQSPNASGKLVLGCASIGHRLGLSPLRARIFGARRETIVRAVRPCDPPVGELPAHLTRAATVVRGADVNAGHAGTCRSAFRAHDPKKRTFMPSSTALQALSLNRRCSAAWRAGPASPGGLRPAVRSDRAPIEMRVSHWPSSGRRGASAYPDQAEPGLAG